MTSQEYIDYVSKEPLPEMIKEVRNKKGELEYRYIPKSILQRELLKLYDGNTKWEMLRETIGAKGMFGTGNFHYKHPVSGEWLFVSGTASLPQDKKMWLGFPALESHCFLNAVKKIGVFFGQTINISQEDAMPDEEQLQEEPTPEETATTLSQQLVNCTTVTELKSYRLPVYARGIPSEVQELYETRLRELSKK